MVLYNSSARHKKLLLQLHANVLLATQRTIFKYKRIQIQSAHLTAEMCDESCFDMADLISQHLPDAESLQPGLVEIISFVATVMH